jgi:peptidoglycan/LPS O-acetylase OafA/YrhL
LHAFDAELGVRIFFVISGFIITHLFLRESDDTGTISIPRFYLRRLIRLYPVNLAFVAFLFVLTRLTEITVSGCQFLTALTYTKNFGCGGWIDGHLWSLAVEEQFYLCWPLAFLFLRKRGLYYIAAFFIVISPISRALEYLSGSRLYELPTSNSDALMIGCVLALVCKDRIELVRRIVGWRPALCRTLAVLAMYVPIALASQLMLGSLTVTLGPMLEAASAGYLLLSFVFMRVGFGFYLLNSRPMRGLGLISYSLYIWQQPFLLAPPESFGLAGFLLHFPQKIGLCLVVGTLSYLMFERPFAALRVRLHPVRATGRLS